MGNISTRVLLDQLSLSWTHSMRIPSLSVVNIKTASGESMISCQLVKQSQLADLMIHCIRTFRLNFARLTVVK